MARLRLPRLVGTREAVSDLMAEQQIAASLRGERLVVLCRDLAAGSMSFADELVKQVLDERCADELVLVGAPQRFVGGVRAAAQRRSVADRVHVRTAVEAGV